MPLAKHSCKHQQQDQIHGSGIRVVNPIGKSWSGGSFNRYRCTVCGGDVDKSQLTQKSKS